MDQAKAKPAVVSELAMVRVNWFVIAPSRGSKSSKPAIRDFVFLYRAQVRTFGKCEID